MKQLKGTPLKRFLRDWRRSNRPQTSLALILQSVAYPVNVGSLFRIADAAGVSRMFLCGITPLPSTRAVNKASRTKQHDVTWVYMESAEEAVVEARLQGYTICGLEITDSARPYFEVTYPDRLCLVVGNEDHGLTRTVLGLCDSAVFVPMYGKGLSLNVHVCTAIVLYHILHNDGSHDGTARQSSKDNSC
jgi:tRNA (guanosine-2'-O-)-methyltransferase